MDAKGFFAASPRQIGMNHLVGWVFVSAFLLNVSPLWSQSLNHLFSQRFGGTGGDFGAAIAVDGAGNVLVTGQFSGTVDFGGGALTNAGSRDIFLAKYDAAGAHLFSQRFGDTDFDSGAAIAVDGAGNVLVTGSFEGTVDFGGGALTSAGNDIFLAKYALPVFAALPAVSGWGLLAIVSVTLLLGCVLLTRRRTRNGLAPESLT